MTFDKPDKEGRGGPEAGGERGGGARGDEGIILEDKGGRARGN